MTKWVVVCAIDDIEPEDVKRFDHGDRSFAIYRDPDGNFFASDGLCTHEYGHLTDGLVLGDVIECPKHNGRFNYKTGKAMRAPVCIDLKIYPVRLLGSQVEIEIE